MASTPPTNPIQNAKPLARLDDLVRQDFAQDIGLKRKYAIWLLVAMVAQIAIADVGFFLYAWLGVDWEIPANVINGWLAATLVEVIGVVLVVTRYLFPRRD